MTEERHYRVEKCANCKFVFLKFEQKMSTEGKTKYILTKLALSSFSATKQMVLLQLNIKTGLWTLYLITRCISSVAVASSKMEKLHTIYTFVCCTYCPRHWVKKSLCEVTQSTDTLAKSLTAFVGKMGQMKRTNSKNPPSCLTEGRCEMTILPCKQFQQDLVLSRNENTNKVLALQLMNDQQCCHIKVYQFRGATDFCFLFIKLDAWV